MVWNRSIRLYSVWDQRGVFIPIEFMVVVWSYLPSWSSCSLIYLMPQWWYIEALSNGSVCRCIIRIEPHI